mgnify:CR=1 FL=1
MSSSNSRYIHSVDGLRAVAVVAVLLYHLGIDWIPGGFLGVDLFFVISGYLITLLLVGEHERDGGRGEGRPPPPHGRAVRVRGLEGRQEGVGIEIEVVDGAGRHRSGALRLRGGGA